MKIKKIKENEPFDMNGKVFIYTVVDGKINLSRSTQKVKKEFIPPKIEEVVNYFMGKGYTPESAQKFYNYYHNLDWKDKNNVQVKNWRAKALSVWFRDENKQIPTNNQITQMIR